MSAVAVRAIVWATCAAVAAGAAGCRPATGAPNTARATPPVADAASAWTTTAVGARTALTFRQHARADSVLAAYVGRYPESPGAAEAVYWRALARLDPDNPAADAARAVTGLEAYRATDPPREHFYEASVLRALVRQTDSLRAALASERSAAAAATAAAAAGATARAALVPRDTLRARDEELARVRADAADARAELERVRRRLTAPATRGRRFP